MEAQDTKGPSLKNIKRQRTTHTAVYFMGILNAYFENILNFKKYQELGSSGAGL